MDFMYRKDSGLIKVETDNLYGSLPKRKKDRVNKHNSIDLSRY